MSNPKDILGSTEVVILSEQVLWLERKLKAFDGRLYATDQRILFDMDKQEIPGALIRRLFNKRLRSDTGGIMIDVQRADIEKVERTNVRKAKFLNIFEKGREKPYQFVVKDYELWEKALANQ
jgi:hypothetical protein